MTPKERAAMQQALEALEIYGEHAKDCPQWPTYTNPENYPKCDCGFDEAITAMREALAEQAEQEPVAWMWRCKPYCDWPNWNVSIKRPVDSGCGDFPKTEGYEDIPLYAAPVRTKDLTDDEIPHFDYDAPQYLAEKKFARAVIQAFKEKNK